jgi:xanthine dehydrogenase small subunit
MADGSVIFILNMRKVVYCGPNTKPLVDVVRGEHGLRAVKVGCREGDCGACTLLLGQLEGGQLVYRSVTSCIVPVGNVHGKHILTLEQLTPSDRHNPIQKAFISQQATQCGFCTPGFIMALTAGVLAARELNEEELLHSIDGNICRCTGYQSIHRAVHHLVQTWTRPEQTLDDLKQSLLPFNLTEMKQRLRDIPPLSPEGKAAALGGGTDFMVQSGYPSTGQRLAARSMSFWDHTLLNLVHEDAGWRLGSGLTVAQLMESPEFREFMPALHEFLPRISSTQIRNEATLGGNLANASPIADFAVIFLALAASLQITSHQENGSTIRSRDIALSDFFLDYKKIDLHGNERIESIRIPEPFGQIHFEKVSKREMLDIASVNTGIQVELEGGKFKRVLISAGGVAPIPMLLTRTQTFLTGKEFTPGNLHEACRIAGEEISPISDIRGTAEYKTRLLQNLILAHFHTLYPDKISGEDLLWQK